MGQEPHQGRRLAASASRRALALSAFALSWIPVTLVLVTPFRSGRADVLVVDSTGAVPIPIPVPIQGGLLVYGPAAAGVMTSFPGEGARPPATPQADPLTMPARYAAALKRAAAAYVLSPALLEAVVWQESRWRPGAVSPKGAVGLAQLMPGTAKELGVDPQDPEASLMAAARYLRHQLDRFDGDVEKALAAYNAGPARVDAAGAVPDIAETRAYVAGVVGRLALRSTTPPITTSTATSTAGISP